jgi:integrase
MGARSAEPPRPETGRNRRRESGSANPSGRLFYRRHFKPAVRAALPARLHGLRFHHLRHTCASLLLNQGTPALAVKEWLGHSSIQITVDRYGHLAPGIADGLAEGLDAAFASSDGERNNVQAIRDGST